MTGLDSIDVFAKDDLVDTDIQWVTDNSIFAKVVRCHGLITRCQLV